MLPPSLLLLILFFTAAHTNPIPSVKDLIFQNCNCTLYRRLCYNSLLPYAQALENNPADLPRLAVNVSLYHAKKVVRCIKGNLNSTNLNANQKAALKDCLENVNDAVGNIVGSVKQMPWIKKSSLYLSNVQTWMSAAMTNADTCDEEELKSLKEPLRSRVLNETLNAHQFISIALALINKYYG